MSGTTHSISIVIPVFRAELTLQELHRQIVQTMEGWCPAFEIVFVEDGGQDRSWSIIEAIAAKDARVRGIQLNRNYGQQNALLCGIRAARYEIVVTMDDDLQHPPEEIPRLVEALGDGVDVVYGARDKRQHGAFRNIASKLMMFSLTHAMGVSAAKNLSPFRAFRTRLREGFDDYRSPFLSIDVLLSWTTTQFASVPVRHAARAVGRSGYTLRKLIVLALDSMTAFSTLPLRAASIVGFALVLFGVAILVAVLVNYLVRESLPGFTFLASLISIFSGTQLFTLGIIGEYLARIHLRSMDRPVYVVRGTIGSTGAPSGAAG